MKGGRPKTDEKARLSRVFSVRLSEVEGAALEAEAARLSLPLPAVMRQKLTGAKLPPKLARVARSGGSTLSRDELRELNAIGVNMNQIARVLNTGSGREIEQDLSEAIDRLQTILERFLK